MNTYKDCTTEALLILESGLDYYDPELVTEICNRAGLSEEYEATDGDSFEGVFDRAVKILREEYGV